jgi:hypothetical protein
VDRKHKDSADNSGETALVMSTKAFKGRCRKCGKFGHKAADCWFDEENKNKGTGSKGNNTGSNSGSGGGKFAGECFCCGKKGHRISECRKKKADEAKAGDETANTAADHDETILIAKGEEVAETALPSGGDKLTEDTWLADTAATTHMTCKRQAPSWQQVGIPKEEERSAQSKTGGIGLQSDPRSGLC